MNGAGRQVRLALLLAPVAGFVDVTSYLVLHRLFVAHVTGNTTEIGQRLGGGGLRDAVPVGVAVFSFAVSIALVTIAIELATRRGWRSPTAVALAIEIALLATFMGYGSTLLRRGAVPGYGAGGFYVLLTLGVCSMGLQTAAVTKWGRRTIRTTYMSGMATRLAQDLANLVLPACETEGRSYLRDQLGLTTRRDSASTAPVYLGLWLGFLAGAILGGWAVTQFELWGLGFPIGALVVGLAIDVRRPVYPTSG